MVKTESTKEIKCMRESLGYIQQNLNCPKNLTNKFGGYKYRNAEAILEAVKPLLKETGLFLLISDDIIEISGRFYVRATVTISNGLENISTTALAREEETKRGMDGSQITGASSSYARKYALNGLFCIDDTKDADFTNKHDTEEKKTLPSVSNTPVKQETNKINANQAKLLYTASTNAGFSTSQMKQLLKDEYGLDSSLELTRVQFEEVLTFLESTKNQIPEEQVGE